MVNIDIKDISGKIISSVLIIQEAISHEELMNSDYIRLSWKSENGDILPAGAYIIYNEEKYSLLEPYTPARTNELEYTYTPEFQSRIMSWQKNILPLYTYEEDGATVKTREMDWTFTGSPADAMYMVQQAIKNETGEEWTVQLADSLPATISISSQSSSIFSVLSDIASQCNTEWWADKSTNTLYLSQCKHGIPVSLTVGANVGVPSVTSNKDGYYTRFYVFGSTRNIVQSQQTAATNSVVNKRLTLSPETYPDGYIDIKPNLQPGEIFVTTLYYDNIYPSSKLVISDVRARLKYRLNASTNEKIQAGTDEEGNPIYEQYAIWYFQIANFDFNRETIIPGLNLSASFETGQLAGREFELVYHEKAETVNDEADVTAFQIKEGDYEIILDESEGITLPGIAYIIPQEGDQVILFNIEMPAEYTESAQQELADAALADIAKRTADNNNYEMDSYPVSFHDDGTDLSLGQAVTYTNGDSVLQTRVLMVEKHLDFPFQQRIKVGNQIIKGNTQQLREEVTQASQNIDILQAFNNLSQSLTNAYANAQREMIEGFAAIKNIWQLKEDRYGNKYVSSPYNVLSEKGITAYASNTPLVPSIFEGLPVDGRTIGWIGGKLTVIGDIGGGIDEVSVTGDGNAVTGATLAPGGKVLTLEKGATFLTASDLSAYATQSWVNSKLTGYATSAALLAVSEKLDDFLEGSDTDNIINKWKELEAFLAGQTETSTLADLLSVKADKSELSKYVTIAGDQSVTGVKDFTGGFKVDGIKVYKGSDGLIYIDGSLAVTGGITAFAQGSLSASTIMDAVAVDGTTIAKVGGKLTVVGGTGGGEADAVKWENILNKPTWLTATNPSYTKTESDNKYLLKSAYTASDILSKLKTVDSTGSGLDADLLDGVHASGLLTAVSSTSGTNLSITVGGTTKSVTGLYAKYFAPTSIAANTDLNSISIPGMYYCPSNSTAATLENCPTGLAFSLMVEQHTNTGFKQTLTEYITGNAQMWVRNYYNGTWGEWRELAFISSNVASATKLQTARSINGTSFDGTANIVTSYWGTARTLSLTGNATGSVSINGSSNVSMNVNVYYAASAAKLDLQDTRAVDTPPIDVNRSKGLVYHFKSNTTDGLADGGTFHSVLQFTQWGDDRGGLSKQIALTDNGNMWLRNASSETAWGSWKKLAFTSDNVASATKLATQRTIWGRPFNGTQNVTGSLTGVEYITMSGNVIINIPATGGYFRGIRAELLDGSDVYLAAAYGNSTRTIEYYVFGFSASDDGIVIRNDNVGIGTTSPARKLDVSGSTGTTDLYINGIRLYKGSDGLLYLDGSLAVTGGITAFAQGSLSAATIMDAVAVDGTTITKTGGVLTAKQFNGGTISQSITIDVVTGDSILQLNKNSVEWQISHTTNNDLDFIVNGTIAGYFSGVNKGTFACTKLVQTSDIRKKTVLRYLSGELEHITKIPVCAYVLDSDESRHEEIGVIAQNVMPYYPSLVEYGHGSYSVDYAKGISSLALQGVKELYALVKQQQQTINELQDTINQLRRAA